jgi:hypothetical protein
MEEAFGVTMLEMLKVIIAACSVHSSGATTLTLEKQRQCQKELVLCVDQLKEYDTQGHREKALWKCIAK